MSTVRHLDHTGDLGFEIEAPTAEGLLARAAQELFALMLDVDTVGKGEVRELVVQAPPGPDQLYHWLREALSMFNVEEFAAAQFDVTLHGDRLVGQVHGEPFDPNRHTFYTEIKAVTLHCLAFEATATGWYGRVVFDV